MSNFRFISYSIFASILWGSLLLTLIYEFKTSLPAGTFFIAFIAVEFLSTSNIERDRSRKSYNEPIKKEDAVKYSLLIFSTIFACIVYLNFSKSIGNQFPENTFISVSSALIGAFWALSIHKAWSKRLKNQSNIEKESTNARAGSRPEI